MEIHALLLFLGVDLLLIFTPGPDWLYIIARGLAQGPRIGLTAVAGICVGYTIYTVLVAAGLATSLEVIPSALPVLRFAGAAYLVMLAIRMLAALRNAEPGAVASSLQPASVVLRQSVLTALLNPKALLLYLSLMPQFIAPHAGAPLGLQVAVLGSVHVLGCGVVYSAVGIAAGRAGRAFATTPQMTRRITAVSATLLLLVAAVALTTSR